MSEVTYTSTRELKFETEEIYLNFSGSPTFLPVVIIGQIRHNHDKPISFGPGMSQIAAPEIQFSLQALPGIFYPIDGKDDGVLVRTAWESAVPYIQFSNAIEGPDRLNVWFNTSWSMVVNTLLYSLLFWTQDHDHNNRAAALDLLGSIRDRLEGDWLDVHLAPHGAKGFKRLIEASDCLNKHFSISETTIGEYSVWLKRKLIRGENTTLESRWTFLRKQRNVEHKVTVVYTDEVGARPLSLADAARAAGIVY